VSTIALWVLGVAVLVYTPGLFAAVLTVLQQPWITIPALLFVAAWTWKPKHAKRALLVGAALAHQTWTRRSQSKTATA
jgi:hypothetical protein